MVMSPSLQDCEASALKLPVADRAVLVQHLIESLDLLDDTESERLWIKESVARYDAYKTGHVSVRPAVDAIRDARAHIAS